VLLIDIPAAFISVALLLGLCRQPKSREKSRGFKKAEKPILFLAFRLFRLFLIFCVLFVYFLIFLFVGTFALCSKPY
jgi:hypothetical protein